LRIRGARAQADRAESRKDECRQSLCMSHGGGLP
jgi:hypothetical protein